jgi:diguanylate cyclase (GGDEF)-like protein
LSPIGLAETTATAWHPEGSLILARVVNSETVSDRAGGRLWWIWLGLGLSAIAGYFALPDDSYYTSTYYDAIGLTSAAVMVFAVRRHRPTHARLWYCFAAGQAVWSVGDITYGYYLHVLEVEPFPSPADALYLSAYPILIAGMFMLIRGRTPGRDRAGLLDASIISTGLGLLAWTFLMRPIAADASLETLPRVISLAYPAADLLMLAMVARLLTSPGARTASYRLLVAAVLLLLGSDITYSLLTTFSTYTGGLVDVGWLLSYVLWTAAALHPSMRALSEVAPQRAARFTKGRFALLAATSLLAPGLLFYQGLSDPQHVDWGAIGLGAVTLFLLVLARMSGLVSQVQDQATQLAALAHADGLTGIPNRRAWDLELAREMALARRAGTPVSVALLDLDHFKRFNDQYGHQAGDRLLTQAAALWKAQLREHDVIARYGGEEFGVIIGGMPADQAATVLSRLLAATPDRQTFSAGVATWNGTESPEQLVSRADGALYEAKHSGRNRICISGTADRLPEHPAPSLVVG